VKQTERIKCKKEHEEEQKETDKEKALPIREKHTGISLFFAECTRSLIMIKVAIMML